VTPQAEAVGIIAANEAAVDIILQKSQHIEVIHYPYAEDTLGPALPSRRGRVMRAKSGGKRIGAAKLILAALVLGLSGLLQRQSLAQPAEDLQAHVQDAIAGLRDQDPEVRASAAETLGDIAKEVQDGAALEPAIPPLIEALQDEDTNVRGRAAEALAWIARKFRDQPALAPGIPPLTEALQDESAAVRRSAAWALRCIAEKVQDQAALQRAIPALIEALQDENEWVRGNAAWALSWTTARVQDEAALEAAIPALIQAFQEDDAYVGARPGAAFAFVNIANNGAREAALLPAIQPLIEVLQDEDVRARGNAACALGTIASNVEDDTALKPAIAPLIEGLQDPDSYPRQAAASALGRIAANVEDQAALEPAIAPLVQALQDEDAEVRGNAASALEAVLSPRQYLAANHTVINMDDFESSMGLLEPILADYEVILTGESHRLDMSYALRLEFTKYLQRKLGVRYILWENGPSWAAALNDYLEAGDTTFFDGMDKYLQSYPQEIREPMGEFWRAIGEFNDTLPDEEKLTVVGVDIEHQPGFALEYLARLLPDTRPPRRIGPTLHALRQRANAPPGPSPPGRRFGVRLNDDIASQRAAYASYLGDRFAEFELVAESLAASHERYTALGRGDRRTAGNIRDAHMYESFRKQYNANPPGKYFGQFGTTHIFRAPFRGVTEIAAHMEGDDSPVSGRVLTILFAYVDGETILIDTQHGTYEAWPYVYGVFYPPPAMVDFCTDEQLVLLKLIGPGSPFDTIRLDPRMEAGTTEYFQFLLLVRGARLAVPGGWH